ncbi:MAG: zinc transporter ZntB [Gammaproteobacteria bacterium]|nr:zinc transporter ZntB [Gammaproteobacteria bacterium]
MAEKKTALIHGFGLDGQGGAVSYRLADIAGIEAGQPHWVHLDFTSRRARDWIRKSSGLSTIVADALLDEDSRPRVLEKGNGVLIILRGVNHNPGEAIDDMVSIRVWLEPGRIISTRRRRLLSVSGLADDLRAGNGPISLEALVLDLVIRLNDRIDKAIDEVNDAIEAAETQFGSGHVTSYRGEFAQLRRQAVRLRRWLAPQRIALDALTRTTGGPLTESHKLRLREAADELTRFLEELDLVRERAMVAQEELIAQLAQEQNSRMYILSLIAAVFLPLSFLTGLMGMNVAGLPGTVDPQSFSLLVFGMVAVGVGILALFKWRKWL